MADYEMVHFAPSQVASAAFALTLKVYNCGEWVGYWQSLHILGIKKFWHAVSRWWQKVTSIKMQWTFLLGSLNFISCISAISDSICDCLLLSSDLLNPLLPDSHTATLHGIRGGKLGSGHEAHCQECPQGEWRPNKAFGKWALHSLVKSCADMEVKSIDKPIWLF